MIQLGEPTVSVIAHTIQLAVAPVFLLSGVAGLLNVLTSRLGRIIDRGRVLESRLQHAQADEEHPNDRLHADISVLARRARLVNSAISLCTASAILISAVIITLFGAALSSIDASMLITILFVLAMLSLIAALVIFLREVSLATATLRIGLH